MALPTPVLAYVGTVDTSNASSGNFICKVTFPSTIRALMFEYLYRPVATPIVEPQDLEYSGFIYPESAQPAQTSAAGVSSYLLPLPVPTGDVEYNVAVRVYNVVPTASYTNWSNYLLLVRPPQQPTINTALYDAGDYDLGRPTTVYLNLDAATVDYTNPAIRFIASYYYVKSTDNTTTVWETTGLLELDSFTGTPTSVNLTFIAKGQISNLHPIMYIAVNAVQPFIDGGPTYYSISEISNTADATQASIVDPIITSVTYDEDVNANQTMTVQWLPPSSAYIPAFAVESYNLEINIYPIGSPAVNWQVVDPAITPSGTGTQTYVYDINVSDYPQGYTFVFRVNARLDSGTTTGYSNVLGASQVDINPPTITSLVYNEYELPANRSQQMVLAWNAPYNSQQPLPAGFNATYDVYLTVTVGGSSSTSQIATGVAVQTYTYDIVNAIYLNNIADLSFNVQAVIAADSGTITTDPSNSESLNTYTYASAPSSIIVNWAVPDAQSSGNVDVSFTFGQSLNPGLGALVPGGTLQYLWQIIGATGILQTGYVTYSPSSPAYTVLTSYTPSGYSDFVVALLQTTNTNPPGQLLNGAAAQSGSIVSATVPFIYDVVPTQIPESSDYRVSFKVASNVILSPAAVLLYAQGAAPQIATPFSTVGVPYLSDLQNFIYTFSGGYGIVIPVSSGFTITVANSAGIGYKII